MTCPPSKQPYCNLACSPLPNLKTCACLPRLFPLPSIMSCPDCLCRSGHSGLWVSVYTCGQASLPVPFLCDSLHTRIRFPSLPVCLTWLLSGTALSAWIWFITGLSPLILFSLPFPLSVLAALGCPGHSPRHSAFFHVWFSLTGEGSTLATCPGHSPQLDCFWFVTHSDICAV